MPFYECGVLKSKIFSEKELTFIDKLKKRNIFVHIIHINN